MDDFIHRPAHETMSLLYSTRRTSVTLPPFAVIARGVSPGPVPAREPSMSTSTTNRLPRLRLMGRAREILQYHFDYISQYPTQLEKQVLLEQVRTIHDNYTKKNLDDWFNNRRKAKKVSEKATLTRFKPETARILYPSLTAENIVLLDELMLETPDPSPAHVDLWASTSRLDAGHVEKYVKQKRADAALSARKRARRSRRPSAPVLDDRMEVDAACDDQMRPPEAHPQMLSVSTSPEPQHRRSRETSRGGGPAPQLGPVHPVSTIPTVAHWVPLPHPRPVLVPAAAHTFQADFAARPYAPSQTIPVTGWGAVAVAQSEHSKDVALLPPPPPFAEDSCKFIDISQARASADGQLAHMAPLREPHAVKQVTPRLVDTENPCER